MNRHHINDTLLVLNLLVILVVAVLLVSTNLVAGVNAPGAAACSIGEAD